MANLLKKNAVSTASLMDGERFRYQQRVVLLGRTGPFVKTEALQLVYHRVLVYVKQGSLGNIAKRQLPVQQVQMVLHVNTVQQVEHQGIANAHVQQDTQVFIVKLCTIVYQLLVKTMVYQLVKLARVAVNALMDTAETIVKHPRFPC